MAITTINSFLSPSAETEIIYSDFSSVSGLTLNGDATQSGSNVRLTSTTPVQQRGSFFYTTPITFTENTGFSCYFTFVISGGADGIVFVIHNDSAGASAVANPARSIGYSSANSGDATGDGIANSVAVGYIIYLQNTILIWNETTNLQAENTSQNPAVTAAIPAPPDWNSGSTIHNWIDYDARNNLLSVYGSQTSTKPSTPLVTHTVDITSFTGGSQAYVGFTASTGGTTSNQDLISWEFTSYTQI